MDGGQIKLHLRARTGTRIEETAALVRSGRGDDPRRSFQPSKSAASSTTSGLPYSGINLVLQHFGAGWPGRCGHLCQPHRRSQPTVKFVRALRKKLAATYPSTQFSFCRRT